MSNYNYNNLTPFKWFVLENFPFIEADFDAITNYQLYSKVVEYLNQCIGNVNDIGEQMETVTNQMITLQNYVDNYFDNLDVQEEINNKLDAMVTDGTLNTIINQEIFGEINNELDLLNSEKVLFIGDSYMYGIIPDGMTTPFTTTLKNRMGLSNDDIFIYCAPGAGFTAKSLTYNKSFGDLINDAITNISDTNKQLIKKVIILGGYNDRSSTPLDIQTIMEQQITILKNNFINAKIYLGMIANDSNNSVTGRTARYNIVTNVLRAYKQANSYGALYLTNSENILKEYNLFASDGIHPNQNGQIKLGNALFNIIEYGNWNFNDGLFATTFTNPNFTGDFGLYYLVSNNELFVKLDLSTLTLTNAVTNNASTGISIDLGASDPRYIRNVFNRPLFSTPVRLLDTNGGLHNNNAQLLYDDNGHYILFILPDLNDNTTQYNKVQFLSNTVSINLINT